MTSDRERLAEIIIEYMPGADGAVDSRTIADAILAAGFVRATEWEYAIQDGAGSHVWPFGPQDEELAETFAACEKALDGNDPDFWDADDHIVRRRKAGPWENFEGVGR